jgi:SagB-type dehydrogenase family enzyme
MPLSTIATLLIESAGVAFGLDRCSSAYAVGPRPYPSGGALYPIELLIYPIRVERLNARFWYYQPLANRLVPYTEEIELPEVTGCYGNDIVRNASALLLLFVDFARPSLAKYGGKEYRLLLLEAGHLAQTILLVAAALRVAALPTCGFSDERLAYLAGLEFPSKSITYSVAVGVKE